MSEQKKLAPNSLSFIALTNEFCQAVEHAESATREFFHASISLRMIWSATSRSVTTALNRISLKMCIIRCAR